jgi:hypothetical protein
MNKINYMKKYIVLLIAGILLFVIFRQNRVIKEMKLDVKTTSDSLLIMKNKMDSLKMEMFVKDIDLGRFEHVLNRAESEMSPECKEELETILSQTE